MQHKLWGALAACGLFLALSGANAQEAAPVVPPAALVLGDTVILRLYDTGNGENPQQRVDALTTRVTNLLGTPNILPRDVTVYAPKGSAPSVYTLGRRLITIDAPMAKSEHLGTPLQIATLWASRLQQVLPRINYRPSNAPEPNIPANPPLVVTDDFTKVGGMVGAVSLHGKNVFFFYGPQPHGLTAQERADQVSVHLGQAVHKIPPGTTDPVKIVTLPAAKSAPNVGKTVEIQLNGNALVDITPAIAKSAGAGSPLFFANAWAKNLRQALNLPDPNALPVIPPAPTPNAVVPVVPAPGN